MHSKEFLGLLVLAALLGVVASFLAWGFLELTFHMQDWVYTDIPDGLGFEDTPTWWPLPVLAIAGVITAVAIVKLPGNGGHIPANGLSADPTRPNAVPGVIIAGAAAVGLGVVLGPEAPLIAAGGGLGLFVAGVVRKDGPPQVGELLGVSSTFAAVSFLFGSPLIAAVLLIEASGVGGQRLPVVLIPGLLASGIGSLTWIGMGSWTGLDTSEIALPALKLPALAAPQFTEFLWTVPLAMAIAVGTFAIFHLARATLRVAERRVFVVLPLVGLAIGGLAILFTQTTDHSVDDALFSGQSALPGLVDSPGAWSLGALTLLILCKGLAYGLSLGSFRGGPTFPAMFLGAAAGLMAAHLPGFSLTAGVGVGLGAATTAVLRLPLSGVVLGVLLTASTGAGVAPLIIVGVTVAYLTSLALDARWPSRPQPAPAPAARGAS